MQHFLKKFITLSCLFCDFVKFNFVTTGLVILHRVVKFPYGLERHRKEVMVVLFNVSICL